jgi:UDP-2,3-diacylglucosamine pyrophosphatase LpxH
MVVIIGDVHGLFTNLTRLIEIKKINNSSLIQVGDFGVGFKTKENENLLLSILNSQLVEANNTMYVIRGNHDDPSYFPNCKKYSNIIFLPDYTLLQLKGKNILLAGGAISIDRSWRVLDNSYWLEEVFVYDRDKLDAAVKNCSHLDIVITHNAPAEFYPTEISSIVYEFTDKDPNLIEDVKKERSQHSLLMNDLDSRGLRPKLWYYGHYHMSRTGNYEGIDYRILDCLDFFGHLENNGE